MTERLGERIAGPSDTHDTFARGHLPDAEGSVVITCGDEEGTVGGEG
jgi:hypothetical protein